MVPGPLIAFGGGLDSGALVIRALGQLEGKEAAKPFLLHIDYGQKAAVGERSAMLYFAEKYALPWRSFVVSAISERSPLIDGAAARMHDENFLPGRNLVLLSLAASVASGMKRREVWTGFHPEPAQSVYEDAKIQFVASLNALMISTYGGDYPLIRAPFASTLRSAYLRVARIHEPDLFRVTFSCYESRTADECGRCTHCLQKEELRKEIG